MNGVNFHDEMVRNMMNYDVTRNGYWFSKEQLEEHDAKVRNNAIDEFVEILTNDWGLDIILAQSNKEKLKSFIVSNGEQLKEQL